MTTATTPPTTAPPDPLREAMDDPTTRSELMTQVMTRLNVWLADLPKTRRVQEAEDIVAESLARAWKKRDQFNPAIAAVGAWLHGITMNVVSEHCRGLRKLPPQPITPPDRPAPAMEDEDTQSLAEFLDQLKPQERQIVEWRAFQGVSYLEIGNRLQISEGNARLQYHRIFIKLRKLASGRQEGER